MRFYIGDKVRICSELPIDGAYYVLDVHVFTNKIFYDLLPAEENVEGVRLTSVHESYLVPFYPVMGQSHFGFQESKFLELLEASKYETIADLKGGL